MNPWRLMGSFEGELLNPQIRGGTGGFFLLHQAFTAGTQPWDDERVQEVQAVRLLSKWQRGEGGIL